MRPEKEGVLEALQKNQIVSELFSLLLRNHQRVSVRIAMLFGERYANAQPTRLYLHTLCVGAVAQGCHLSNLCWYVRVQAESKSRASHPYQTRSPTARAT